MPSTSHGSLPRIVIGRRTIDAEGTGVTQYGDVLVSTLRAAGAAPLLLDEDRQRRHPALRQVAAALPGARRLREMPEGLHRKDAFREAQTRFRRHGRLLTLKAPGPPGIIQWTYPLPMRIAGWRNIYTVHDVIPLDPRFSVPVDAPRLARLLHALRETADGFVTVSEAARGDVIARTGCTPAMVVNASQAVDVRDVSTAPLPAALTQRGYFLFTGRLEERKNLVRLVAAHRQSGSSTPLLLAGPVGGNDEQMAALISGSSLVHHLGFQPRPQLLQLIANAKALLFPSLAEGFGLPVAEAMALGTPVLTSRGGALEETAGGAALLVDPLSTEEMADAIRWLDVGANGAQLTSAGLLRAAAFSQDFYGERLLSLYRNLWHG